MYRVLHGVAFGMLVAVALPGAAEASALPEVIGLVRSVDGASRFISRGQVAPVRLGQALVVGAVLETDQGRLGLALNDGTRLVLGPESRLRLAAFEFAPARRALGFRARLERGSLYLKGGELTRLAGAALRIDTADGQVTLDGAAGVLVRAGR